MTVAYLIIAAFVVVAIYFGIAIRSAPSAIGPLSRFN